MLQSNRERMLELKRMSAGTNRLIICMSGCMQSHEAAKLDAEMTVGKVVSLMVGPVTRHEKPLLLVISQNI